MNNLITFLQKCIVIFENQQTLFVLHGISLIILVTILHTLHKEVANQKKTTVEPYLFFLFLVPIIAILIENIQYIALYLVPLSQTYRIISCIAWMLACFKFHSFLLFIELLINKKIKFDSWQKTLLTTEIILCLLLLCRLAYILTYAHKHPWSDYVYCAIILFWIISTPPLIIKTLQSIANKKIPLILQNQIKTLFIFFFLPHFICVSIEFSPYLYAQYLYIPKTQFEAFGYMALIFITASFYFCFKRIMQFRFLNLSDHVQIQPKINISANFKNAIDLINVASNPNELKYITQDFFNEQFNIAKEQLTLYVRTNTESENNLQKKIETFLSSEFPDFNMLETLLTHKILVRHEIEFDEFHTSNHMISTLAQFLRDIQCDIFLPIIHNKKLLGYITIQTQTIQTMYNLDQQNKMLVFAKFLAPAMYMLQQQNTYVLLQETKAIKEELHEKQQEINQYKESIKQLLKDRIEHHIGIIFYKGKHFAFKNLEAQQLLLINPNLEPQHPTSVTLINFAQQIEKFKTTQNMYLPMHDGSKLMVTGMPHAQTDGGVLLMIRKPEATDLIKMHIDALQNPSQRDYLLYLETTQIGQSINKLLPSDHELFLHVKIQLLQAALQKSALLLENHTDDIDPIVEIIHQIHPNQVLYVLNLQKEHPITSETIFGLNPLLNQHQEQALLEKLNNGILLIKNIEYLDTVTQQKLAHMIRYGIYTPIKSEQRKFSDTRVICSTTQNLTTLHQEGIITSDLYHELQKNRLILPSLITMSETEISQLIDGFMYQNLQTSSGIHLRALTYKDKQILIAKRIASLFVLQQKVYNLMSLKASEASNQVQEKNNYTTILDTSSPELRLAAQLGKHALKDIQLMKTLWKRLGNQTKIADLLGVNRSSVNRRCKEYNLI